MITQAPDYRSALNLASSAFGGVREKGALVQSARLSVLDFESCEIVVDSMLDGPPVMMKGELSRRSFASAACLGLFTLLIPPSAARADASIVEAELRRLFGAKPIAPGRVALDLPEVAENGLMVAMSVAVESPMTPENYVRSVYIFAGANPSPHVLTWHFTPASGRAAATGRIRLARSQTVFAIAEMSGGALHMAKAEVIVTVGGCGE